MDSNSQKNNTSTWRYDELFSDEQSKARAFDRIAREYYKGNFGRLSKADFELLMFDIYIEQLFVKMGDENPAEYSDYRLSKDLGITQSKVSSLKIKKQLQYPREYDWRESFMRSSKNVRYEQGKIKLQIPDINVYYEVKNAIEEAGGYVEVTLTSKLLQIPPEFFLDFLEGISDEKTRESLRKELRSEIRKHDKDHQYFEAEPIGKVLGKLSKEKVVGIVSATASAVIGTAVESGTSLAMMIQNVCSAFGG